MRQQYECLDCKFKMWGERSKHDGAHCPKCKGPILPINERRAKTMDKLDYLLQYLRELQVQWSEAHVVDGPVLEIYKRIVKVNDSIEEELARM